MAETVLVVGAGTIGHGLAVRGARAGRAVTLVDPDATARARAGIAIDAAMALLDRVDGIAQTPAGRGAVTLAAAAPATVPDLVFECVPEVTELKRQVLAELGRRAPGALLLTTTSALPITSLAEGVPHPERVVGAHVWNPPYILPGVEVVRGAVTSEASMVAACAALQGMGWQPVRVERDLPGFVGNRLQHALLREAVALVEAGVITAEALDALVTGSFGPRLALMGPLERADLGGLDVTTRVQETVLPHLSASTTPAELLTDKVAAGHLGVKSGQGFYRWEMAAARVRIQRRDEQLLRLLRERDGDEAKDAV